jgi:hypothetical protein
MLYAILCYNSEDVVGSWSKAEDDAVMEKLVVVTQKLAKDGRLGPVARLLPTTAATTLRKSKEPLVMARSPKPRSSSSGSTSSIARRWRQPSRPRASWRRPTPDRALTRSGRCATSTPGRD